MHHIIPLENPKDVSVTVHENYVITLQPFTEEITQSTPKTILYIKFIKLSHIKLKCKRFGEDNTVKKSTAKNNTFSFTLLNNSILYQKHLPL